MLKKSIFFIFIFLISFLLVAEEVGEMDTFIVATETFQEGSYESAQALFNRFLERFPNSQAAPEAKLYIGQCLFYEGKFSEARNILTELETLYVPRKIEDRLLFWLGQVYYRVRDYNLAAKYFKKVIDNYPNSELFVESKIQLGNIYFEEGSFKEAINIFNDLAISKELSVVEEALFKKGEACYNLGDYKATRDTYDIFTDLFLDSDKLSKAFFYLGQANFYLEDYQKAVEAYTLCLKKTNDDMLKALSLERIGWSYLKQEKLKEAEEAFLKVDAFGSLNFNKEWLYFGKALLYFGLDNSKQAIEYYDKLIQSYPKSDMVMQAEYNKAQILSDLLRFDEAKNLYLELIEKLQVRDGDDSKQLAVKARYNLGSLYLKNKNFNSAIKEFEQVVFMSAEESIKVSAFYQIAEAYQENNQLEKAIEIYKKILNDYPQNSFNDYSQYQVGLLLFKLDKFDEAIATFKIFNDNFNQSSYLDEVNYYLSYAYFKKSEFLSATQRLQKFLEVFLDSDLRDEAMLLLASSFYNRGMFDESIQIYEKVLQEFGRSEEITEEADYNIANNLYRAGKEELAIKSFEGFINKHPKSNLAQDMIFWLGQYYLNNNQYEFARRKFETFIRMYPGHELTEQAEYQIGLVFLAQDNSERARQTFEKILAESQSPNVKIRSMLAIGDLLLEQGRIDTAKEMYKELIKLASSDSILQTQMLNQREADISINKLNKQEVDSGTIQFVRQAYIRLGDLYKNDKGFASAIDYYKKAENYLPESSNAQIKFLIAECLQESGNLDESLISYIDIPYLSEQDNAWIAKGLLRAAKIYEDREQWQGAVSIYEKLLSLNVEESKVAKEKIESIKKFVR